MKTKTSVAEIPERTAEEEQLMLKKKNEEVKAQISFALDQAQAELNKIKQEAEAAREEARAETAKMVASRAEFEGILTAFNKERSAFEAERQKMIDRDEDCKRLHAKLSEFVTLIRREASKF